MRRYLTLMESDFPTELGNAFRAMENSANPWGMSQTERADWTKDLEGIEVIDGGDPFTAEYLYWVGCAGSFDDKNRKVTQAMAKLMQRAEISFAILGPAENCTGDPARRSGNEYIFQMLAMQNIELMNGMGVRKIITQCPHCFNTLLNEYPQLGGIYEVVHHSQFLEWLIDTGKLDMAERLVARVTAGVAFPDVGLGTTVRGSFDVAIIDQHMPEVSGTEWVTRMRASRTPAQLPVVLLTRLGHAVPAGGNGVAGCSSKPVKPRPLLTLVREALTGVAGRDAQPAVVDENISRGHPLRVLLAEDNAVNQRVAALMLKKLGYAADIAGNGREAIAAIERREYDLVFMDLQMPEMDGLEATRAICARWPATNRPRIVAMTANVSSSDREACMAAGMDGFTSKPVRMQDLREAILATSARVAA